MVVGVGLPQVLSISAMPPRLTKDRIGVGIGCGGWEKAFSALPRMTMSVSQISRITVGPPLFTNATTAVESARARAFGEGRDEDLCETSNARASLAEWPAAHGP